MTNSGYLLRIMQIICLTVVIALLFLPWQTKNSLSYISGAVLSAFNIWWLWRNIRNNLSPNENRARLNIFKNFYLRYLFLIVSSVILVRFARLNIVLFGIGLLAGQIVILLMQVLEIATGSKGQE